MRNLIYEPSGCQGLWSFLRCVSHSSLHFVFKDPHAEEFEDKEWTFVIENVSVIYDIIIVLLRFAMCRLTPAGQIE